MKTLEDIVNIRFSLVGLVSLDLERAEQDPVWDKFGVNFDTANEEEKQKAIGLYLSHYFSREDFLTKCPSTNGPADLVNVHIEKMFPHNNA